MLRLTPCGSPTAIFHDRRPQSWLAFSIFIRFQSAAPARWSSAATSLDISTRSCLTASGGTARRSILTGREQFYLPSRRSCFAGRAASMGQIQATSAGDRTFMRGHYPDCRRRAACELGADQQITLDPLFRHFAIRTRGDSPGMHHLARRRPPMGHAGSDRWKFSD